MPRRSLFADIYVIAGIIGSILIISVSVVLAVTRTNLFGRAAETSSITMLSRENSYVFASPISAQADGRSIIRITVFLLNDQGLGVEGQKVEIKSSSPLNISPISPISDSFGRAMFDLTAQDPGSYTISAESSGAILPQTISIVYR